MNKEDLESILKRLSQGFINKYIDGPLYKWVSTSLILANKDLVPELYKCYLPFLDIYVPGKYVCIGSEEVLNSFAERELSEKIMEIFKIKKSN